MVAGSKTISLARESGSLGELMMGVFESEEPLTISLPPPPTPRQGDNSTGFGNGTRTRVQASEGTAARMKRRFLSEETTMSVIVMAVMVYSLINNNQYTFRSNFHCP